MRRSATTLIAVAAAAAGIFQATVLVAAEPISLPEFVASKSKWSAYADLRTELWLEGRYSTISTSSLQFTKCDLPFQAAAPEVFSRIRGLGTKTNIEVSGHMTEKDGKPIFIIEKAQPTASEIDRFATKRRALRDPTPAGLYELGEWARTLGSYYEDEELKKKAGDAFLEAVQVEHKQLAERTPATLLALAKKVKDYNLPAALSQSYIHEAYRIEWDNLRSDKQIPPTKLPGLLAEFEKRLAQDLDGAREQLAGPRANMEKSYRDNPIQQYEKASAEDRRVLHRLFDMEVILFGIERAAKPDGSNGWDVGGRIDALLPDRHDVAEKYRERQLAFDATRVSTMTKEEAVTLANRYRQRNRPDLATSTLKSWLDARRKQIRDNDAESLRQLAEQYTELLDDKPTTIHFLMQAYRADPESKEVADALNRRGLYLRDGQWQTEAQIKEAPRDPLNEAMKQGIVIPQMNPAHVRGALGEPTATMRIATADTLDEIWIYREGEKTRIAVHLQRRRGSPPDDARVIATY